MIEINKVIVGEMESIRDCVFQEKKHFELQLKYGVAKTPVAT